ncbi:recombinase family protein [Caproiciproducens sp. NJN-50]|uniref:recombinase family protein n=1 Tax=Caproiciproducens sp. NJN-50 TaxID=2507162 RepID=UPI000FFE22BE|nr:recombinase family protein [Caproiciproducens sp. NJN-50]QAT49030.1 recombinase family protein [Caproiciproducens sp. NJN-50]
MEKQVQTRIAIYSRKSRFTGKGESIENQIELCRQYIAQDYGAAEDSLLVYEDEGFSGGSTDRPQFKKMMADARGKKFSILVCYRLDRISRNIGDFARLIEELGSLSISFVSIREQFDTASPMGRAMMYIASVFSQLERETTAERIRDNMRELAKTGRWLGGTTPTGYRSQPIEKAASDGKTRRAFRLVFQPDEIKTVRLIFQKFLETDSLTQVETFLIQNSIPSKTGKRYTRFAIKNILENPVYMAADPDAYRYFAGSGAELCAAEKDFDGSHGIMAYNKTLQQHGKANRAREMSNWIVAIGRHQGILSGEDWIRVQKMLERNKSKSYRKPKNNTALLSGLLRCGRCGSYLRPKLTRRKNRDGEPVYTYLCELKEKSRGRKCSVPNINGNSLDQAVCSEIISLPEDGSAFLQHLKACCQALKEDRDDLDTELERLNQSIQNAEKAISNLVSALAEGRSSAASRYIIRQIDEWKEKEDSLEAGIQQLKDRAEIRFLPDEQIEMAADALRSFSSAFGSMTVDEKRCALRSLIDRVVWDGETVSICLFGAGPEATADGGDSTAGE